MKMDTLVDFQICISVTLITFLKKKNTEAATGSAKQSQRCSKKNVFLNVSRTSRENTCVGIFFNKVAGLGLQLY